MTSIKVNGNSIADRGLASRIEDAVEMGIKNRTGPWEYWIIEDSAGWTIIIGRGGHEYRIEITETTQQTPEFVRAEVDQLLPSI